MQHFDKVLQMNGQKASGNKLAKMKKAEVEKIFADFQVRVCLFISVILNRKCRICPPFGGAFLLSEKIFVDFILLLILFLY